MRLITSIAIFSLIISSCGDADSGNPVGAPNNSDLKAELQGRIDQLSGTLFDEEGNFKKLEAGQLLAVYIDYTNAFHEDTKTCEYRLQAAELAQTLERYRQAIELYRNVNEGCPDFQFAPQSVFMIAVIHQDFMNDREGAKKYYEEFIRLYPDHELTKDAMARINTLYMTDEEIVRMFEEKLKSQESTQ